MHAAFRFGLPPGSALVLVAMLEMFNPLMSLYVDWIGVLAGTSMGYDLGPWEYFWLALIILEILITSILLLYGVIFKGRKSWLLYWMGAASAIVLLFILIELFFMDWTFETMSISLNSLYIIVMILVIFGYELHLAISCLPQIGFTTISELEPIGKGWRFLLEFYKNHAKEAASLVLMFEVVLNTEIILDRQMTRFVFGHEFIGYEGDSNIAIITEETVIRYVRIGLAAVGFFIAYKEKKYWMFRFCLVNLVLIAISCGIFIYLFSTWRAEHYLLTFVYLSIFLFNLFYRTGILFLCIKYTDVFERSGIPM